MPRLLSLKIDTLIFSELVRKMDEYKLFSKRQADRRIERGSDVGKKDVFARLMEARDPETGGMFQMPELVSEASLLVIAGRLPPSQP